MPSSFPPEILDLIVDHLHDAPTTLKACCLVAKSWVPRARRSLFAHVEFSSRRCPIQSWLNVFPDASNSPAHHTRALHLVGRDSIAAAIAGPSTWLHHFCHVEKLQVANVSIPVSFVQLRGLSPNLRFLHLFYVSAPLSEIFALICSFPLLEDLWLHLISTWGEADGWEIPSTSPRLTGTLYLSDPIRTVTRGLLDLPNGLHFSKIMVSCLVEDAESVADLVSKCSETLESLVVAYYPQGVYPFVLVIGLHLNTVYSIY